MRMLAHLRGVFALLVLVVSSVFWCAPFYLVLVIKGLLPMSAARETCRKIHVQLAQGWIASFTWIINWSSGTQWNIHGLPQLSRDRWYLVLCNHASYADIPALVRGLGRDIPMLKFFAKRDMIWTPIIGFAMWALDFPFMHRYSEEYLEKHPEKRGRDLETGRESLARFRSHPGTIVIYPEGTRFTSVKRNAGGAEYQSLLRPKAGGVALALSALGDKLETILDVTLIYPDPRTSIWRLFCGQVARVEVHIKPRPVPEWVVGADYQNDAEFRERFQEWLGEVWQEKDALISKVTTGAH